MNNRDTDEQATIVLVRDLLFASRITSAATEAGVRVRIVRDGSKLVEIEGRRLIVDLNAAGFLEAAAEWKRRTAGEVIGFVSHVDEATIARSRSAGIDRVLSNGGFTSLLPTLMSE